MAAMPTPAPSDSSMISEAVLHEIQQSIVALKQEIFKDMSALLAPIFDQLDDTRSTLQQVSVATDTAMEAAIDTQNDIQLLQHKTWARDKIVSIDNAIRQTHLKICGIPGKAEANEDLSSYLARWLASEVQLEPQIALMILHTYQIGSQTKDSAPGSRDIIIVLQDI